MDRNIILEDINRIKEIMNIGVSLSSSEVIEEQLANLFGALEKNLITSTEKQLGKKLARATDQEIQAILGKAEMSTVRTALAKTIYEKQKRKINGILNKYNLSTISGSKKATFELEAVGLNPELTSDVMSTYRAAKLASGKTKTNVSTSAGGKTMVPKPAAPKPAAPKQNSVLKPKPKNNIKPITTDELPPNADEIILNTAKSSPEAAAFMHRVDALGFNNKITQLLKLEYGRLADVSTSEIIKEGNGLVKYLNEKNYGWIQRGWASFTKNPTGNVKEAGKTTVQLILWKTLISLALVGSAYVLTFKRYFERETGVKASDALPSLPNLKSSSGEFTNNADEKLNFDNPEELKKQLNKN
jgi:hypothetical protein